MSKDYYTEHTFKVKWKPCVYYPSNIFGNARNLLEDLKIGEYHSTGEYFTVVAEAFSDAIRRICASENI